MRIYLDLCCLKRPFDLQDQPLVRLQTEAVLSILELAEQDAQLLRSEAMALENSLNPVQSRRDAVALWIGAGSMGVYTEAELAARTDAMQERGFKGFDAFHLACAELADADVFLTVDVPLQKVAARVSAELSFRVLDPVHLVEEISTWKH